MSDYKTIEEYLRTAEEQIRWKRARPVVSLELRRHMEDQRDAFAAEGFADAERMAVEEMGDPVAAGTELDRLHRPKPQWGLLGMTIILAMAGSILRIYLTAGYEFQAVGMDKAVRAFAVGIAILIAGYFFDVSRLFCHPNIMYIASLAAGVLSRINFSHTNPASYPYTAYVVQLYPIVYAVWLYKWQGKGWKGFLAAVAGCVPLTFLCVMVPSWSALYIMVLSFLVLTLYAVWADWFQVCKPFATVFVSAIVLLLGAQLLGMMIRAGHLQVLLHPELYRETEGFVEYTVRTALAASQWIGAGSAVQTPFEQFAQEWSHGYILTTVAYKLGWLPFLLLVMSMAVLLARISRRCFRYRAGQILSLSVVVILFCRIVFSLMMNMGVYICGAGFPMLAGNLQSVVDMGLIGLALSVFRGGDILRESVPEKRKSFGTAYE